MKAYGIVIVLLFVGGMVMIPEFVNAQPIINSVSDNTDPVEIPGYNNITADITGAIAAYVVIYYPDGTIEGNHSMGNIGITNIWYYNASYAYPYMLGQYNYTIKAYDGNQWVKQEDNTTQYFILQDTTSPSSSVDALPQYWYNTQPITITVTASDNYNGKY